MKKTRSLSLLIASLFVTWLLPAGCGGKFSSHPVSDHIQADAHFIQFIEKSLGTDWYGIYLQENKVGYLKSTSGREKGPDGIIYKIQLSGIIQNPSQVKTDEMKIHMIAAFMSKPPFSMICFSDKVMHNDDIAETRIIKTSKGYEARITQGGEMRAHVIGPLEYGLKDYTAVQKWIAQAPKEGAEIKYFRLNLATLALEEQTARIIRIRNTIVSGVKTSYCEVLTKDLDGLEVREIFGADGRPYRIVLGGVFECRLEPKSQATHMDAPAGLFVKNTVPVDLSLGDPETVTLLKLLIDKKSGVLLKNASGQSVTHARADGSVIVTLNYRGGYQMKVAKEEIEKNLAATIDVPVVHPKIFHLARGAVGSAKTPAREVNRLVHFVYQYIEDDYTVNPLTLMDIITKRKGDCSEHAKLFTAMARALGIPCRTVSGLVYLGDESQEFGLHAWNEAAVNGLWVPVDPTWGQTLVDATHIRFPIDISEEWQVLAAIPKMKIEILQVEHKK
ncbi:MAG: transglutaminase-like domain-containing protein [Desulfobacterales bacterium]